MPDRVTLEFDDKTNMLIILDETGKRKIGRLYVPVICYPTKEEV